MGDGQAVFFLTGLLEVFISESSILATVSDNSENKHKVKNRCNRKTKYGSPCALTAVDTVTLDK